MSCVWFCAILCHAFHLLCSKEFTPLYVFLCCCGCLHLVAVVLFAILSVMMAGSVKSAFSNRLLLRSLLEFPFHSDLLSSTMDFYGRLLLGKSPDFATQRILIATLQYPQHPLFLLFAGMSKLIKYFLLEDFFSMIHCCISSWQQSSLYRTIQLDFNIAVFRSSLMFQHCQQFF